MLRYLSTTSRESRFDLVAWRSHSVEVQPLPGSVWIQLEVIDRYRSITHNGLVCPLTWIWTSDLMDHLVDRNNLNWRGPKCVAPIAAGTNQSTLSNSVTSGVSAVNNKMTARDTIKKTT